MKMQTKNKFTWALFLLFSLCLRSQAVFTYGSFLSAVKELNPLSKKAAVNQLYGDYQLRAARGNYDPLISSNFENKQFGSSNYYTYLNAEVKQPLYTSHYLKVGYQYAQGAYINPEKSTPSAGIPYLGLEASLAQGFVFDKRRAELVKAKHYSDFYDAEQKIQMNELLYAASVLYAEALMTKKVNQLYDYFTQLAEQRLKGVRDLAVAGERASVDTIEASIFLQGRVLDKQASRIDLEKKMNDLVFFSTVAKDPAKNEVNILDSLEQLYTLTAKSIQLLVSDFESNNPVLKQYNSKQKILETEKRLRRELIKPVLNVNYNFLANSNEMPYPLNLNNYKWGAYFSLPVLLRKSRFDYKLISLEADNVEYEMRNKQNQLSTKKNYLLNAIQLTAGQLVNAEKSAGYSRLLLEAERLKFESGESSLFLLNSRENKWLEAELKLAEYKLKQIRNLIELTYINGNLAFEMN